MANTARDRKKRPRPFVPQDFMPEKPMTAAEKAIALRTKFDAAMMALGGRTARPDEMTKVRRARLAARS